MYPREFFDTFWRNDIKNEVFVAMPFHDEFDLIWNKIIKPGIEENNTYNLIANRVDATVLSGSILTNIFDGIAHSKLFLADISIAETGAWHGQRNGNVMYEVGLAHALRHSSEIMLIRSDEKPINFDIMSIMIHKYDRKDLKLSKNKISELVINAIENIEATKSLTIEKTLSAINPPAMSLLSMHGSGTGFYISKPKNMGDELVAIKEYLAIQLFIEKNVIEFDINSSDNIRDFYKWTNFGVTLLKRLKIRT